MGKSITLNILCLVCSLILKSEVSGLQAQTESTEITETTEVFGIVGNEASESGVTVEPFGETTIEATITPNNDLTILTTTPASLEITTNVNAIMPDIISKIYDYPPKPSVYDIDNNLENPEINFENSTSEEPSEDVDNNYKEGDNTLSLSAEESPPNPCNACIQSPEITNLNYTFPIGTGNVFISWDPITEDDTRCQHKYTTRMAYSLDSNIPVAFTRNNNSAAVEIPTRALCGRHVVEISAANNCSITAEKQVIINIAVPEDMFYTEIVNVTAEEVAINVTLPECRIAKIVVACHNLPALEESEGRLLENSLIVVRGLEPFTKYECSTKLYKNDNEIVAAKELSFQTEESAPTEISYITASHVTSSSFILTWANPIKTNGILRPYDVTIIGTPLYNSPFVCDRLNYSKSFETVLNFLNLTRLPANQEFNILITPKTSKLGPVAHFSVSTLSPPPSQVEDLNVNINNYVANQPRATITWKYPCNTFSSPDSTSFKFHIAEDGEITRTFNEQVTPQEQEQLHYAVDLQLEPSTNYTVFVYTINLDDNQTSDANILEFRSPEGITKSPTDFLSSTNPWNFDLSWTAPAIIFGDLQYYEINITYLYSLHLVNPKVCETNENHTTITLTTPNTFFYYDQVLPNRKYLLQITPITSKGPGDTLSKDVTTKPSASLPPAVLHCTSHITPMGDIAMLSVEYEPPCDTYGVIDYYLLKLIDEQGAMRQVQQGSEDLEHTFEGLQYEVVYNVLVTIVNKGGLRSIENGCTAKTPAGIPDVVGLKEEIVISHVGDKQVEIILRDDYFHDSHGEVKYFALLVGVVGQWKDQRVGNGVWDGVNWPSQDFWNEDGRMYQATPANWKPLEGSIKRMLYTLGIENCTGHTYTFCNGPLRPNTEYYVVVRGFTAGGFRTSNKLKFITEDVQKTKNVILAVGIISGLLLILVQVGIGCVFWKRKAKKKQSLEEANQIVHAVEFHTDVAENTVKVEDFLAFYNERKPHLGDEYERLAKIGVDFENSVGSCPNNRKKNRYINILPYDSTRVCLQGCKNDYINASYVNGYSGQVEYIATQGPLENTSADFWTMVLNTNCTIIAMVAHFEEQKKTKCYRYFPEVREQMEFYLDDGGELTVRCSYALNYDYYIERQIVVQSQDKQLAVTHLQFLNWPDFGCPEGTQNMLQFTKRLRRHMEKNDSMAIVHCSAGVGRTGTLIAVDMLLQTIKEGRDINIYDTVAKLRQQRTKMVQAESQYLYLYQCIMDEILQPRALTDVKPTEPIYETMENLIEMKILTKDNNNDSQVDYLNQVNQHSLSEEQSQQNILNIEKSIQNGTST